MTSWMLAALGSLAMVAAAGGGWMWNETGGQISMTPPHEPMQPQMHEQMPHEPGACPYYANGTMPHGGDMQPGMMPIGGMMRR